MSKNLLLEIGTEEIPARFMPNVLKQLESLATDKLKQLRIQFKVVKVYGTPRRMALMVEGLAEKQADISTESKGPSIKVAFDGEGKATKAAQGFARGQNVAVEELFVKDDYVYAKINETGKNVEEILPELLVEIINSLNFPKNMRWADLEMKFVRPIKWLIGLLDNVVIDFEIAGVKSGNVSRGHRFLSSGAITINNATEYVEKMAENFVVVNQELRRSMILQQIEELAASKNGRADITEDLLEEVVYLVEYPTALCGVFEEKYLKLPPETVVTPMREHQRYFPVKDANGSLMPMFITVRNGGAEHLNIVQHGNERVLRARLADAQFFFEEDCKVPLIDRLDKLKTIVFQEGLGTIYDKVMRIKELAAFILGEVDANMTELVTVERGAILAKTDLVTGMVCEFTELQGLMGKEYALLNGETPEVANAIFEHYLPRFAGDELPESVAGKMLSIADKIDNIVATFSRGLIPTGSQDPYALRRQALGIVNILIAAKFNVSIKVIAEKAMELLNITDTAQKNTLLSSLEEFFALRIKNVLSDENVRYDIIEATLNNIDDVYLAYLKAQALVKTIDNTEMPKAIQAFVRVGNLAKKAECADVSIDLLQNDAEKKLHKAYQVVSDKVEALIAEFDYVAAINEMVNLTQPIDEFFANVMVMDENEAIRNNRLALLNKITMMTMQVIDFSKIK